MITDISISSAAAGNLKLTSLTVSERLGEMFNFDAEFQAEDTGIDLSGLLSTAMTIKLATATGDERYFNGMVCEAEQIGVDKIKDLRYATYRVKLVPRPWLLGSVIDCRIFKEMSTVDIVRAILQEVGYSDLEVSLSASYPKREYCVQYREDGLNFINRLMQQEGIYYYFKHSSSTHTMVLADGVGSHSTVSGFANVPYLVAAAEGKAGNMASIREWTSLRGIDGVKVRLTDYNPLTPKASLLANASSDGNGAQGVDIFDYPGTHQVSARGTHYAQMRAEAISASRSRYAGATLAYGVTIGALFTLEDYPRSELNVEYLITGTAMVMTSPGFTAGAGGDGASTFRCRFEALESKLPWRTPQTAEKPLIPGLQTAIVTGTKNEGATDEDIVVDKYGRVQVNFHWNMPDKKYADNSCPVRVATMWAGKNWGAVNYPRVGHEVVVSFIDGDPERPLIVGSVYHAVNMPIHANFPDERTKMGFRSRSLLDGAEGFSEICIDDKKGEENVLIHAQKDSKHTVENDHAESVGNDQEISIHRSQTINIGPEFVIMDGAGKLSAPETADFISKLHDLSEICSALQAGEFLDGALGAANFTASIAKAEAGSYTMNVSGIGGHTTNVVATAGQTTMVISPSGQSTLIGIGPQKTVVANGSQELYVHKGQEVTVGEKRGHKVKGDDELEVEGGRKVTIKKDSVLLVEGKRDYTVMGDDELEVDGQKIVEVKKKYGLNVGEEINLYCGQAKITMKESGDIAIECGPGKFTVNGMNVSLEASTAMSVKGATVEAEGTMSTTVKGGSQVAINGGIVQIN